jgi:hypothetical protein
MTIPKNHLDFGQRQLGTYTFAENDAKNGDETKDEDEG